MITPDDVIAAAASCRTQLAPLVGDDEAWEAMAGDLDWTCRSTLDHITNALILYAGNLATRTAVRRPRVRNGDPRSDIPSLLLDVETAASILAAVGRATPPQTRAFHPAGMADVSGFMAMGCAEIVIHTEDIGIGLGATDSYRCADELAARLVQRLFPWTPQHDDPWERLRWSMGRTELPGHGRLAPDWGWQCAPLDEWDGTMLADLLPPGSR
jgi:hypothetical protein